MSQLVATDELFDSGQVFDIEMPTRFRGITRRQGMIIRGRAGWAEWSPFLDYAGAELVPWLTAAIEAAEIGYPAPVRDLVPVNCTVPAVGPEQAHALVLDSGCRTAKVKVAEPGQSLAEALERVEAVRDALGPQGGLRVDANGAWDVASAAHQLRAFHRFDLEYAEQPCADVEELAELRRLFARAGTGILIAADESIRRAADPFRVRDLAAADIAVLKVQPLGGVNRCLEIAEAIGLPVVVSSALETSIGIAAGVALAAALPELPFACGLNTVTLLADDLVNEPLSAVDGVLPVRSVQPSAAALARTAVGEGVRASWQARLAETRELRQQ